MLVRVFWKLFPKRVSSLLAHRLAKNPLSKYCIPLYIKIFKVDMKPVKKSRDEFANLLDFFIREYKDEARIVAGDHSVIVSPVDGVVSQMGDIEDNLLLQAKGKKFSLDELLGAEQEFVDLFREGKFITVYLGPKDYHRIHVPMDGKLVAYTYIPGTLYPVNPQGVKFIPMLFAQNERLISYIKTAHGMIAVLKVGALNVGSIRVNFSDELVTNPKKKRPKLHEIPKTEISFKKGEELGRFEFGSTVILLFQKSQIDWLIPSQIGLRVQMGEEIARFQ